MKKIIITVLVSAIALINVQATEPTNIDMCKTYIKEAKSYQETMKSDVLSEATLAFYKDNVVAHCGNIVAKVPYEANFFALQLMKKDITSVNNCKLAIEMAKSYDNTADKSPFITHAHKINITDNCGTLVAKSPSGNCLFDVVDNSKEGLKERCVASIKKAHAAMGTDAVTAYKKEVVANCGRLRESM